MAELTTQLAPETHWTATQTRAQFGTIAWLRWRMLLNGFRRKGGAGEMAARIILYPVMAGFAFGPTLLAGGGAFYFVHIGRADRISLLLWVTFGFCQLLNIQLGQPGSTFDPTQLIRFPLSSSRYTAIRLFFGLLTPANVIGTMMSLAIAVGAGSARACAVAVRAGLARDLRRGQRALLAHDLRLGRPLAGNAARAGGLHHAHLRVLPGRPVPELHLQPGL
jgi:hypothetical protein